MKSCLCFSTNSRRKYIRSTTFAAILSLLLALIFCCAAGTPAWAQSGAAPDPNQVRQNLKNILDDGEFHSAAPQEPSLFSKMVQSLKDLWEKFKKSFEDLFPSAKGLRMSRSPGIQWVFIAAFLIGGGWLLYRLIRNAWQNREKKRAETRTAFDLDETEEEIVREPDAWLAEAEQWLKEGDYRRAYRALFVASLLQLDRAGMLVFQRSRTNGEYLRTLRRAGRKELYAIFDPLVLEFELRWYGEKPTDADDAAAVRRDYERIISLLSQAETLPTIASDTALPAAEGA